MNCRGGQREDSAADDIQQYIKNPLVKKIEQVHRRTGFDSNFLKASTFHLKKLQKYVVENKVDTRYEYCNLLLSKLFIDKTDFYVTRRFSCQVNENSNWPVPVLPSDIFGEARLPMNYRKESFHAFLKVGDILDCRVASVLPTHYQLRVIHKYGIARILDDLKIMVKMDKTDLLLLKKELLNCELIRAAVCKIVKDEKSVHVTVDERCLELGGITVKLGRISDEDLPSYVLDPPDFEKYSCYAKYLKSVPQFSNSSGLEEIVSNMGINPHGTYSYFPVFDRMKCPEENMGQALLRKSEQGLAKQFMSLSFNMIEKKNFTAALEHINAALAVCPAEDVLRCTIYQIRGDIYKNIEYPKNMKKAFYDWIASYHLNPNHESVKTHMSNALFQIANKLYRNKEYKKAKTHAEVAIHLNKNNKSATPLLEYLKSKLEIPYKVMEDDDLQALQKQKKKLESELKKYKKRKLVDY